MLSELCDDKLQLAAHLREVHEVCEEHRDFASASCIGSWIDDAERRVWFLFEANTF
jgi:starvation-inducible DNA-binding protein